MKIKKFIFTVILLSFVSLLSGCDMLHVVSRSVRVQQLPAKETVEKALRDVPEIKGIRYSEVHREDKQPPYFEFNYWSDHASGNIAILKNVKGEKVIDLTWGGFGKPQRAEVVQILDLMDKVYSSLLNCETNLPPKSEMQEEFFRIKKP